MIVLFSLPRGTFLFLAVLTCVAVFFHSAGAGDIGDALKAVVMGGVFVFLLRLRRG